MREGGAVELAAGGQGEAVEHGERGWDHVRGKGLAEALAGGGDVEGGGCGRIGQGGYGVTGEEAFVEGAGAEGGGVVLGEVVDGEGDAGGLREGAFDVVVGMEAIGVEAIAGGGVEGVSGGDVVAGIEDWEADGEPAVFVLEDVDEFAGTGVEGEPDEEAVHTAGARDGEG